MTEKRFTRIVDHTEKEVRIFDEVNGKTVFNIFFMELDSAICLNGALTEVVDLLNEQHEEIQHLEKETQGAMCKYIHEREMHKTYKHYNNDLNRENKELKEENEQLKHEIKELEAFRYAVFKNIEKEHRE